MAMSSATIPMGTRPTGVSKNHRELHSGSVNEELRRTNSGHGKPVLQVRPQLRSKIAENINSVLDNLPYKWLASYEYDCKSKGWSSERMLSSVSSHLGASARKWFDQHKTELKTWEIFKSKIVAHFGGEPTNSLKRLLQTRVQLPNETVREYIHDTLRLCNKVDPCMPESKIVEHLIRGISDVNILYNIVTNPPKSVEKLKEHCFDIEWQKNHQNLKQSTSIVEDTRSVVTQNSDSLRKSMTTIVTPNAIGQFQKSESTISVNTSPIPVLYSKHIGNKLWFPTTESNTSGVQNGEEHAQISNTSVTSKTELRRVPCNDSTRIFVPNDREQLQRLLLNDSSLVILTSSGNLQRVPTTNSNQTVRMTGDLQRRPQTLVQPSNNEKLSDPYVRVSDSDEECFRSIPNLDEDKLQSRLVEDPLVTEVEKKILKHSVINLTTNDQRELIRDVVRDIIKEEITTCRPTGLSKLPNPETSTPIVSSTVGLTVLEEDIPKKGKAKPSPGVVSTLDQDVPKRLKCKRRRNIEDQPSLVGSTALDKDCSKRQKLANQQTSTVGQAVLDKDIPKSGKPKSKPSPGVASPLNQDVPNRLKRKTRRNMEDQPASVGSSAALDKDCSKCQKLANQPTSVDKVSEKTLCKQLKRRKKPHCHYCCKVGHTKNTCWELKQSKLQALEMTRCYPYMAMPPMYDPNYNFPFPFYRMSMPQFFLPSGPYMNSNIFHC